MEEIIGDLCGIATTSLNVGWPLLIVAFGLAGAAYFGGRDKVKTAGGWVLALLGLLLFIWNLNR